MSKIKEKMKKLMYLLTMVVAMSLGFVSCSNEDDNGAGSENSALTHDAGVVINGIKWATRNIDAPGTFSVNPESLGMLYQWNKKIGWSSSNPMKNSNGGTVWDASISEGATWEKENDPSPAGWRVPTLDEIKSLCDEGKVSRERTTLNGVYGVRFTDKTSATSIFLPYSKSRENDSGTLDSDVAYWSSTKYNSPYGYKQAYYLIHYYYNSNGGTKLSGYYTEIENADCNYGFAVRSVAE